MMSGVRQVVRIVRALSRSRPLQQRGVSRLPFGAALARLEALRHAELALERQKQRLIAEAEADRHKTARGVLRRDVAKFARKIAKGYLDGNPYYHPFSWTTLYSRAHMQHQNACRCDDSAFAADSVLGPVLERIAERHYGGSMPPKVRDHC